MAAPVGERVALVALRSVMVRVRQAAERSGRTAEEVRVVAVSKTKPLSLIRQVYDSGHRCFGENYVQEILEKAPQLPDDIEWHFIGHLQSNKVKSLLAGVPNISMVQGVHSEKIANHLDNAVSSLSMNPLKVLVQVNTSGEPSKSGVDPSGVVELAKHVKLHCPNLQFSGLMTIGMPDYTSTPENFRTLSNCRLEVCKALGFTEEQCELSMGMSGDFEQALAWQKIRPARLQIHYLDWLKSPHPGRPWVARPQKYSQGSKGYEDRHESGTEERAPSTAEVIEKMAEERLRKADHSVFDDKTFDGAEEATLGEPKPESVNKDRDQQPGAVRDDDLVSSQG
uniref:Pyridoxal phosphate homeostasis protein n=1 Tax=Cannabis sativa TaxID=3483 RepID=A0A803QCB6_CANSA